MRQYFYGCISMIKTSFLNTSLARLIDITEKTHNDQILNEAKSIWRKHLNPDNPLWEYLDVKPFYIERKDGSAHVIAMVDKRLPNIGLVGFFGCTDTDIGAEALHKAVKWLKEKHGLENIYGPINGTITRDYRLNYQDDFKIPGEPVNPLWYIDAFEKAGFKIFNRYVSGISKHYRLFIKLLSLSKPPSDYKHMSLRPFNIKKQMEDLKIYHELMNAIFPHNSIYCPAISWEERVYNMTGQGPIFNPKYSYFLEDKGNAVGFIISYPYQQKLIVKTIGLLPKYRGKNLSGILIKKVHDQASKDGLKAAVYSTIRVGNTVYKMRRPGVRLYRKYATMHFHSPSSNP